MLANSPTPKPAAVSSIICHYLIKINRYPVSAAMIKPQPWRIKQLRSGCASKGRCRQERHKKLLELPRGKAASQIRQKRHLLGSVRVQDAAQDRVHFLRGQYLDMGISLP